MKDGFNGLSNTQWHIIKRLSSLSFILGQIKKIKNF